MGNIDTVVLHQQKNDYFVGTNMDVVTFVNGPYYLVITGPDFYRIGRPESVTVKVAKAPAPEADITLGLSVGTARRLKEVLQTVSTETAVKIHDELGAVIREFERR